MTEAPKTAAEAFAESGFNLVDLAKQHADMMRANAGTQPVNGERSRAVPQAPVAAILASMCFGCGGKLAAGEELLCGPCEKKGEESRTNEATRVERGVEPSDVGDSFPTRHRAAMAQFKGAAVEKGFQLLPKVLSGSLLFLYGPPGRGKTGLAAWWEWKRLAAGKRPGLFMTAQDFFSQIKATWSPQSKQTEDEFLRDLRAKKYVVIDEMDERSASDWEQRTLFNFINHSYNDVRTLVLISNLTEKEIYAAYPTKMLDRINEAGGMVHCDWQNYREKV